MDIKTVAYDLNMSHSAVRDSLKRIRAYFNDEIIIKDGRILRRTDLSRELIPILDQISLDIQSFIKRADFLPFNSDRQFVIAASDDVVLSIGPDIVKEIECLAPNALLQFVDPRWAFNKRLEIGDLDLMITSNHSFSNEVYGDTLEIYFHFNKLLYKDDFVLIGRPGMRNKIPNFRQDLDFQPGALFHIGVEGTDHPDDYRIGVIAPNFTILPFLVANSDSLALVPRRVAHSTIGIFDLELFELQGASKPLEISAYWSEVHQSDLGHQWLRSLISRVADAPLNASLIE